MRLAQGEQRVATIVLRIGLVVDDERLVLALQVHLLGLGRMYLQTVVGVLRGLKALGVLVRVLPRVVRILHVDCLMWVLSVADGVGGLALDLVQILIELQIQGQIVVVLAEASGGTVNCVVWSTVGSQFLVGALADDRWA